MNSSLTESTPESDWEFCCGVEPGALVEFSLKYRWLAGKGRRRFGAVGSVLCLVAMVSGVQSALAIVGLMICAGVAVSGWIALRQRPWLTRGVLIAVREDSLQVSVDGRALLMSDRQLQRMGIGDEVRPGEVVTQRVNVVQPSQLAVDGAVGLLFLPGETLIAVVQDGRVIAEV